MRKDKIKAFLKEWSSAILIGSFAGFIGVLLAKLIFDFVDKVINDLAFGTGILAIATIILAFFTYWNIRSRKIQEERNRKEQRLKEVIDWASDILICGRDISRKLFREIVEDPALDQAAKIESEAKFNVISWKGVYIRYISYKLNSDLYYSVVDTQRILRQHVKIIALDFKGKIKNPYAQGKHRNTLDNSAKLIIDIAVNLMSTKTKSL